MVPFLERRASEAEYAKQQLRTELAQMKKALNQSKEQNAYTQPAGIARQLIAEVVGVMSVCYNTGKVSAYVALGNSLPTISFDFGIHVCTKVVKFESNLNTELIL